MIAAVVIHFYCPECKEELEAEEEVRGTKMNCPACWKEITVPMAGVRPPTPGAKASRTPSRERIVLPREGSITASVSKPVLLIVVVAALFLTAGGIAGLSYYRALGNRRGPKCETCQGTGKLPCPMCKGSKQERCPNAECQGGKITNFRGEQETCLTCNGTSTIGCRGCAGTGTYGCAACGSTGYR